MKIVIYGAAGKMGQHVAELCSGEHPMAEAAAYVSRSFTTDTNLKKYKTLSEFKGEAYAVIDFSNHSATKELIDSCIEKKLPVVIATTGHTEEEKALIYNAASSIPVFFSANMSVGIAVLAELAKKAAAAFPDADIEIIEKHHNRKLDVPSGTALLLADRIKEARPEAVYNVGRHEYGKRTKEEIGIHSVRLGNEVGTHEILISTGAETITLKHEAESRALFAEGAVRAAAFVMDKPAGLYTMRDMLEA